MNTRPDEQSLSLQMRDAGLRVTRPRLTVLAMLHEMRGHRSAEELLAALRERGSSIPRASVYNVLTDLLDHGLIMLADAGPGRALYEAGAEWHHHFVCRDCGHIIDVPCAVGAKPCMEPALEGLVVDEAQVIFRGACPFRAEDRGKPDLGPRPTRCVS